MLVILQLRAPAYHPRTQGQVERYNRTIVAQLTSHESEDQESWDELVSVLSLAYNCPPQLSTGAAPSEFFVPERVRSLSLERMSATPYAKEVPETPSAPCEYHRAHLRNLVHQLRKGLASAQRWYKRACNKCVRSINKTLRVVDWAYIEAYEQNPKELYETVLGPLPDRGVIARKGFPKYIPSLLPSTLTSFLAAMYTIPSRNAATSRCVARLPASLSRPPTRRPPAATLPPPRPSNYPSPPLPPFGSSLGTGRPTRDSHVSCQVWRSLLLCHVWAGALRPCLPLAPHRRVCLSATDGGGAVVPRRGVRSVVCAPVGLAGLLTWLWPRVAGRGALLEEQEEGSPTPFANAPTLSPFFLLLF